jgi:hypothetical protein
MKKSKKLPILKVTKLNTILGFIVGLIAGIIYGIGGFIVDAFVTLGYLSSTTWETPGLSYGTVLAMGALIGMPIIFAIIAFVLTLIGAFVHNLFVN